MIKTISAPDEEPEEAPKVNPFAAEEQKAAKAQEARESVGDSLSWQGEPLNPYSWGRQRIFEKLRFSLKTWGTADMDDLALESAKVVWLCLHDEPQINALARQTVTTPSKWDDEEEKYITGVVVECPLLDTIELWASEQFSGPKASQRMTEMIELKNLIDEQIAAVQMVEEDADEDDDEPGKPDPSSIGSTAPPSKKRAARKKKSTGKSVSRKAS